MSHDYVTQNVFGYGSIVKHRAVFKTLYQPLLAADVDKVYFLINTQQIKQAKLPANCRTVIISFHTEYYNYNDLIDFFNQHRDCNFMLLSDGVPSDIWPANVAYIQWISYGLQLALADTIHGHATSIEPRTKSISSLSFRHEFHKAAITAYLVNEVADSILSWHDCQFDSLYYTNETFDNFPRIQYYLNSPAFTSIGKIVPDEFNITINSPIANGCWKSPAYLHCKFNLTNESVYNTQFANGRYTTPYLTEKTWKPLLAAQPFIPVGQAGTLDYLSKLGLVFDYGIDLTYDECIQDYNRMEKLYDLLDHISEINYSTAQESANYNLNMIVNGTFNKNCTEHNLQQVDSIISWIKQHG